MTDLRNPYRIGAFFIGLSGIMHLAAPVLSGFAGLGPMLGVIGLAYLAAAWGLFQGWRWLAYVMLFVMMGGSIAALTGIWAYGAVPGWVFAMIFALNWLAVLGLFAALWRAAPQAAQPG